MTVDTSRGFILRPSEMPGRDRGGGARTTPLVTSSLGATGFLSGITTFAPGASIPLHFHNCEEIVFLHKGKAIAEIDGTEYNVEEGEVSFIPAGIVHRFRNASTSSEMAILWTYASVDATRTMVATGETRRIDEEHRPAGGGAID